MVLAHQGGWDEILMVLGPLAVLGALLVLAKRRADRDLDRAAGAHTGDADAPKGDQAP